MKKSIAYIIIAGILWGTSGIFVNYLAPAGFTSLQMTFFRSIVAFFCLLIYALTFDRRLLKITKRELLLFAGSGISFYLTASCYFYCMQITSISTAVVLMYTAPIFVLIYSVIFLGEKLSGIKTISIICIIFGCGLVSGIIGGLKFDFSGVAIGLASGLAYSSYNILTKIQMSAKSNPVSATLYCFLFATIASGLTCDIGEIGTVMTPTTLLVAVAMGICTCILPYFLYTLALKRVYAGTATALGIVEPMSATIFSVLLFKEKLGIPSFVGIVLILGAVFLLSREEGKTEKTVEKEKQTVTKISV